MERAEARVGIVLYVRAKAFVVSLFPFKRVKHISEQKVYNAFEMSAIPNVFMH